MKIIIYIVLILISFSGYSQKGTFIPDKPAPSANKPIPKHRSVTTEGSTVGNLQTWIVDAQTAPCNNAPGTFCLRIKKPGSTDFEVLEEDILNFNYDIGYTYTIQVKVMKGSTTKYIWVKTLSKIEYTGEETAPVQNASTYTSKSVNGKIIGQTSINTSSPLDKKWYLRKMKDSDGTSLVTEDNIMYIEINTFKDYLKGFGACNNFEAVLKSDQSTTFQVIKLTPNTYTNCGNKIAEDDFLKDLQEADRFEIRNEHLILSKQWGYLMEFTSDPNNKEELKTTYTPPTIVKNDNATYATDANLPSKTVENNIVASALVTNVSNNPPTILHTDSLQKVSEALQKQLTEKKQKEASELEKARQDELKKQQIELEKITKLKEAEELSKQQLLSQKTNQYSTKPITNSQTQNNDNGIPIPPKEKMVYYLTNGSLEPLEKARMIANSENGKLSFSALNTESTVHFKSSEIPRMFVKLPNNVIYSEYLLLFNANVKNDTRNITAIPPKNRIEINITKISEEIYEIKIPTNISSGEYIFLFMNTKDIVCFGISR